MCCLTVFVVSEQVLNDFGAFLHDFDQKKVSSERRVCFGTWSQKNHFPSGFKHSVAVFDVFKRISIFVLFDRFGRLVSKVLDDWKCFDTNLVNKLIVTTFYLVFGQKKQFLTVSSVFFISF